MNEWQRNFLHKLESAKKQWLHKFEEFAADFVEPAFLAFEEFAAGNGFRVTQQPCEPGHRIYKFALTENGYLLLTFRMRGLEEVEVRSELFMPGLGGMEPSTSYNGLCEAGEAWVEAQFQNNLDRFITHFGEAGAANRTDELVSA